MNSSHQSQEQLQEALEAARAVVEVGARYSHYKQPQQFYCVTELAILEATDEVCVIYQAAYGERLSFVRPLSSWLEKVEVAGSLVARFTKSDPQ